MKIVYVEYEVGGKFPWSAVPDKKGNVWIPYNGPVNKIARLNPQTGELDDFPVPSTDVLRIHSAVPAPDGSVWFSEQFRNKIGRLDPQTGKVSEFEAPVSGTTHTIRVDSKGMVWSTGSNLYRFDPETHKFTTFPADVGSYYGIVIDKADNVWAGGLRDDGKLYRVNSKDEKRAGPHRPGGSRDACRSAPTAASGSANIFRGRSRTSILKPKRSRNMNCQAGVPARTLWASTEMKKSGTPHIIWMSWDASIPRPGK